MNSNKGKQHTREPSSKLRLNTPLHAKQTSNKDLLSNTEPYSVISHTQREKNLRKNRHAGY